MKSAHWAIGVALCVACGGGGGGGGSSTSFAGLWSTSLAPAANTCGVAIPTVDGQTTINQDEQRIVVQTPSGRTYIGFPDDGDSFTATRQESSGGCLATQSVTFFDFDGERASILYVVDISGCASCSVTQVGSATRL